MRADHHHDPPGDVIAESTELTAHETIHTLRDGGRLLVRSLRPSDRDEIAAGYELLSPASRRLRFFLAPDHLSERLLDYLTDVDGVNRVALAARAIDEPGAPGVAVARYARDRRDPTTAEAAVTVLDTHRNRGIATILLTALVDVAVANDITTFTASVMWDNKMLLDALRDYGAVVVADEPGVAAVSVDLPHDAKAFVGSPLHQILHAVASRFAR